MPFSRRAILASPLVCPLVSPMAARAQSDRPIRYIVPFPPAGLTDIMARLLAQRLGEVWGRPVVVENRAGGNAMIGAEAVARAAPDGQTWLAMTLTHAVNATLIGNPPYDLLRDLATVSILGSLPLLVVVNAASPHRSLEALAEAARAGHLNAGSSGNGSPPHLGLELFRGAARAGGNITHVPYRGGAPSVTDLVAGNLDFMVSNLPECIGQVQAGRLRALATTGEARHRLLPDVPTAAELGMASLTMTNWTGLQIPSATPPAIAARIEAATLSALAEPAMQRRVMDAGFDITAWDSRRSDAFLRAEVVRWGRLVEEARIRPDA